MWLYKYKMVAGASGAMSKNGFLAVVYWDSYFPELQCFLQCRCGKFWTSTDMR